MPLPLRQPLTECASLLSAVLVLYQGFSDQQSIDHVLAHSPLSTAVEEKSHNATLDRRRPTNAVPVSCSTCFICRNRFLSDVVLVGGLKFVRMASVRAPCSSDSSPGARTTKPFTTRLRLNPAKLRNGANLPFPNQSRECK